MGELPTALHSEVRHRATPAHQKASLAQVCLVGRAAVPIFLVLARPAAGRQSSPQTLPGSARAPADASSRLASETLEADRQI